MSYIVYDGSISSSILDIFTSIYFTHHSGEQYLICRVGQYDYVMFVGESLVIQNNNVTLNNGRVYEYSTYTSYVDNPPSLTFFDVVSETISCTNLTSYIFYCRSSVSNCIAVTNIASSNLNREYQKTNIILSLALLIVVTGVSLCRFIQRLFMKGDLHV